MTTCIAVRCPHCHSDQIVKRGKTARGTQRYLCQNQVCVGESFLLDYRNRGCLPKVLAYVFGRRQDEVFLKLQALLEPFGLTHFYTDRWGTYTRHLDSEMHTTGKRYMQKIERKHLTLRTRIKRLVRKTICFSKSTQMHDLVIGLFVNRYAFGRAV
jgi:IS1 family transposase